MNSSVHFITVITIPSLNSPSSIIPVRFVWILRDTSGGVEHKVLGLAELSVSPCTCPENWSSWIIRVGHASCPADMMTGAPQHNMREPSYQQHPSLDHLKAPLKILPSQNTRTHVHKYTFHPPTTAYSVLNWRHARGHVIICQWYDDRYKVTLVENSSLFFLYLLFWCFLSFNYCSLPF